MPFYKGNLSIQSNGRGLYEFTNQINAQIRHWDVNEGIAFLFLQHTSASLVINENYDSSARRDMERFLDHLAPESQNWHEHTLEGKDDSPAHMRTIITHTSMTIPIDNGRLSLGSWQGIYLAEHRRRPHYRQVLLRVLSNE